MSDVQTNPSDFARNWLRLEAAALFLGLIGIYFFAGYSWIMLLVLFFVPDLSMLGYVWGPVVGAWCYNIIHSYVLAVGIAALWLVTAMDECIAAALILAAHISFDRMLGYGLKSKQGFSYTHLGLIGKAAKAAALDVKS